MYALEGSAVMSDTNGNLLFYTNGQTVWNKNHQVMENGTGLIAFISSSQPAIIVPQPGIDSCFFIFTTNPTAGLYYHKINITANGGLGKITEKNNLLMSPTTEKLAATFHANGSDVWVSTHEFNTNAFYSYLVTEKGVNICPVISKIGSVMGPDGSTAQLGMNFSPSGNLACLTFWNYYFIEILNFNNSNGQFKNPIKITSDGYAEGMAFSKDEKSLFVIERFKKILQYNIENLNSQQIINSKRIIHSSPILDGVFLNGLDTTIYFGYPDSNYLGTIHYYNDPSKTAVVDSISQSIAPKKGKYGMPNFISSYYYFPALSFSYTNDCKNNFEFTSKDTFAANSLTWTFSKDNQIRTTQYGSNVSYTFPETGNWSIKLRASNGTQSDSVIKEITVYTPYESMGKDTVICADSLLLDAGSAHCYLWQDSSTDQYFNVKQSGEYAVKVVTHDFCTVYDTINVVLDKHSVNNVIYRNGDTLFSSAPYKKYQWYRNNAMLGNETASKHMLSQDGRYKLLVTDEGNCTGFSNEIIVDTLTNIQQIQKPVVTIYPNPSNESGFTIQSDKILNYVIVYSVNGQKIKEFNQINSTTIHISGLSKGVYILSTDNLFYHKITIH